MFRAHCRRIGLPGVKANQAKVKASIAHAKSVHLEHGGLMCFTDIPEDIYEASAKFLAAAAVVA